jgi:hypothetical protein
MPRLTPNSNDLPRRAVVFSLSVFLVARVAYSLVGLSVGQIDIGRVPRDSGTTRIPSAGIHNLWDGFDVYDAGWFQFIADEGYEPEARTAAFFPAYPMMIWAVTSVPGVDSLTASTFVANVSLIAALIVLYLLTTAEVSELDARRTILVLISFPTSFFLFAPYSEAPFLFFSVLAFAAVRRQRWVAGGIAGAVTALTRLIGIAIMPAFLVEAWMQPPGRDRRRALWAVGLVAMGPLLYLGWWQVRTGDALRPLSVEDKWGRTLGFPLVTLARGLYQAAAGLGASDNGYWVSDAVLTSLAIIGVCLIARRIRPSYTVYAAISIAAPLCLPYPGRDLLGMSRFVLVLFPAFWGLARLVRRPGALAAWLAVSIPLAAWHAMLFMHYRHIY